MEFKSKTNLILYLYIKNYILINLISFLFKIY